LLRSALFINRLGFDVGGGPVVQLLSVESDTALADGEFVDMRANLGVKHSATHAQVRRGLLGPDEAGEECEFCIH
jgi:hypothetical protein